MGTSITPHQVVNLFHFRLMSSKNKPRNESGANFDQCLTLCKDRRHSWRGVVTCKNLFFFHRLPLVHPSHGILSRYFLKIHLRDMVLYLVDLEFEELQHETKGSHASYLPGIDIQTELPEDGTLNWTSKVNI